MASVPAAKALPLKSIRHLQLTLKCYLWLQNTGHGTYLYVVQSEAALMQR